jgi:hypothetical protein
LGQNIRIAVSCRYLREVMTPMKTTEIHHKSSFVSTIKHSFFGDGGKT